MALSCDKCGKQNRDIARYCKYCGKPVLNESSALLEQLVGMGHVKEEIKTLVKISKAIKDRQSSGHARINMHTIITGNTGTGKTTMANLLQQLFFGNGIITKAHAMIVDAPDYDKWLEDYDDNIDKAKGGILFIDNAQKLLPGGYANDVNKLDKLFSGMDRFGTDPIIILGALPGGFDEFLSANPSIRSRFEYEFHLPDFSHTELSEICIRRLKGSFELEADMDCRDALYKIYKQAVKTKDESFGNGHLAADMAEDIYKKYIQRVSLNDEDNNIATTKDIPCPIPETKNLEEVLKELEEFIGMEEVKTTVKEIARQVQTINERAKRGLGSEDKIGMHFILTGNPGTGKTTIARKLGEIFEAIGFLDGGHVIEVDRSKIVGQYTGQTPQLVNDACDKAMGGILFVDEAYTLAPVSDAGGKDKFGTEAIETLMKRMEDDRGNFVVIAAGYKTQMDQFLRVNPGMKSRFNKYLHIDDYQPDELLAIFKMFAKKKKYRLHPNAEERLLAAISDIYESRDKDFGNGREMRKLFEDTSSQFSDRISRLSNEEQSDEALVTIMPEDIPYEEKQELDPETCMAKLNELSGLDNVKKEVRSIIDLLNLQKQRGDEGARSLNSHFIYAGNPGTGKTTVARIMADIFKGMGVLAKGHLIEADRSELVAGFKGQTAIKTNNIIDKAMGGVLFIDEAYTLSQGENDDFGQQAIDTLLKRMEDDRGKFIVIAAGYTAEMDQFIDTNPGLKSRFNKYIDFEDYKPEALEEIFRALVKKNKLELDTEADENISMFIQGIYNQRDKNFGNAREMRKIFEEATQRQSTRLTKLMAQGIDLDPSALTLITREDIEGEVKKAKPLNEILAELDEFIGMDTVKKAVREIAAQMQLMQHRVQRGLASAENTGINIVLTGNPGTGKTTIARKLGEVFKTIGVIKRGQVVEVDRSKLVGQYTGQTPKLVEEACQRAMGGILFVDEAYTLAPVSDSGDKDKFGTEAVETLMKRMEDDRGKYVVIVAGYQTPMEQFLNVNPGMKSRFDRTLHIDDYTPDELYGIFNIFVKKKGYKLHNEAIETLKSAIEDIYNRRDKDFANAREMRKLFDATLAKMSGRLTQSDHNKLTDDDFITIITEDIPYEKSKDLDPEECMAKLNELSGLDNVKKEVRSLIDLLNLQKQRGDEGAKTLKSHFVFAGNPGTGKTTVARIMADIFKAMGVLSRGHLVEADRSELVAGFSGQTAIKTNNIIDKAMGGLLFIDEAYTLAQGENDTFGQQAIDTLLKRMEDDRGKFIVIAAGYTAEMDQFISTNPGLKSRFNKYINFEDYKPKALEEIFRALVKKNKLTIEADADENISMFIQGIYNRRDKNFGNAREMRKIFEEATQRQSTRLTKLMSEGAELEGESLSMITRADIEGEVEKAKPLNEILAELDEFIGMDEVKQAVRQIAAQMQIMQERVRRGLASAENAGLNVVLTGNPGTGKTTIARKLGEVFKTIGVLSRGNVVEVDRSQLVGQYTGQTPKLVTEACNRALGGILFVDEAYTLAPASGGQVDKYGQEAIETLMKRMEDDRGKFVMIAAGYKDEMEGFLNANPGMKSRFDRYLHINDYQPDELYEIFKIFVKKKKYILHPDAEAAVRTAIEKIYKNRDKNFANAREMRKLFDNSLSAMSSRITDVGAANLSDEDYQTILAEDIPSYGAEEQSQTPDYLKALDCLVGLDDAKEKIAQIAKTYEMNRMRMEKFGVKTSGFNTHLVFLGDRGSGKSSLALALKDVFTATKALTRPTLTEINTESLLNSLGGQYQMQLMRQMEQTRGGILFLDHFDILLSADDEVRENIINALLQKIVSPDFEFCLIIGGNKEKLLTLLDASPSLKSRFAQMLELTEYESEALANIFKNYCTKNNFTLSGDMDEALIQYFDTHKDNGAHEAKRLFEHMLQRQSIRLSPLFGSPEFKEDMLNELRLEDLA